MKNLIYMLALGWVCCIAGCNCGDCEDRCNPECKNYCNDKTKLECCNYDPICAGDTSMLGFRFVELGSYDSVAESYDDTLSGSFYFQARYAKAKSYEWKVGTDTTTWRTRTVFLLGIPINTQVRLIVTYPDGVGLCSSGQIVRKDTFYRYVRYDISPRSFTYQFLWEGTFLGGFVDNPSDTFRIVLDFNHEYRDSNDLWQRIAPYMKNIPRGFETTAYFGPYGCSNVDNFTEPGNNFLRWKATFNFPIGRGYCTPRNPKAIINIDRYDRNRVIIDMEYGVTPGAYDELARVRKRFIGYRVR